MTKRKPLLFDSDQLTKDLKSSAGRGVDALFAPSPTTPPSDEMVVKSKVVGLPTDRESSVKQVAKKKPEPKTKDKERARRVQPSNITSKQACNITITVIIRCFHYWIPQKSRPWSLT